MARIDIPFLIAKRVGRAGSTLYYWQPSTALRKAGWRPERLPDDEADAIRRAKELNARLKDGRAGENAAGPRIQPGTVADLIRRYKASRQYASLAAKTRRDYDYNLASIEDWAGEAPVRAISPKRVQKLYDSMREATPSKANAVIRVLRLLLQHGVREDMIEINPAAQPGLESRPFSGKLWPLDAVDLFVEVADRMGRSSIGTAVLVNHWLGQREGDIIALQRSAYRDGSFHLVQNKTGARIDVPHSPAIAARVEAEFARQRAAKVTATTIIVSETTGAPYKEDNFRHQFHAIRAAAAQIWPAFFLPGDHDQVAFIELQFMHLRHTALTELANAGCTIPEIAAISGHTIKSVESIIDRYLVRTSSLAKSATQKRLNRNEKAPTV